MRIALLSLSLTIATPAAAQIWDGGHGADLHADARPADPDAFAHAQDAAGIHRSIRTGVRRGELTRREARDLRAQVDAIGRSAGGPAAGIGTQRQALLLGLGGLVDAKRARARAAGAGAGRRP